MYQIKIVWMSCCRWRGEKATYRATKQGAADLRSMTKRTKTTTTAAAADVLILATFPASKLGTVPLSGKVNLWKGCRSR